MKSYSDSYKAAGVDVTAGYKSVELMKEHVKRTSIPGVAMTRNARSVSTRISSPSA